MSFSSLHVTVPGSTIAAVSVNYSASSSNPCRIQDRAPCSRDVAHRRPRCHSFGRAKAGVGARNGSFDVWKGYKRARLYTDSVVTDPVYYQCVL